MRLHQLINFLTNKEAEDAVLEFLFIQLIKDSVILKIEDQPAILMHIL